MCQFLFSFSFARRLPFCLSSLSGFSACASGAFGSACLPCDPGSFCPAGAVHVAATSVILIVVTSRHRLFLLCDCDCVQASCRRCRVRSGLPATRRRWHYPPCCVPPGASVGVHNHSRLGRLRLRLVSDLSSYLVCCMVVQVF